MNKPEIAQREPSLHKVKGKIFILIDYMNCNLASRFVIRVAIVLATPINSSEFIYDTSFAPEDIGDEITDVDLLKLWPHRVSCFKHGWRSTDLILADELKKRGYLYIHNKWVKVINH